MAPRNDVEVRFGANTQAVRSEVQRMIGFTRASLASLGVGLSVGAISNEMRKAVDGLKEVSKEAKTAGVAFEAFQELSYAAKRNLVSVEALTDGLKEMQLRADEFAKTGKGSAAEAFARLGYDAKSVAQALREPDAMFEEIIEKLQSFDKAAQIRIADEVFGGTAGEQFVRLLDESQGSIADLRKEARDLGIIIEDDLRKRVEELDKAFGTVVDTVGQSLHKAILLAIADLGSFLDRLRDIDNRTSGTLNEDLAASGKKRLEIETKIFELQDQIRNKEILPGPATALAEARLETLRAQMKALEQDEARILGVLEKRRPITADKPTRTEDPPLADPKTASEIERQRKAVLELIDALAFENELMGKSEEQKRVDTALRKAGTAATEEQRQKIEALVRATYSKEQAVKAATKADQDAKKAMEEQGRIADRLNDQMLSSLEGLATRSLTAKEALIQVGFAALKALLDVQKLGQGLGGLGGGGGIGGLLLKVLGGAIGGGFKPNTTLGGFLGLPSYAGGGETGSGARAGGLDGKGGFLALLHPNERVTDYTRQLADPRAAAGGLTSSPGVTVSIQIPIDATGADSAAIARLEAGLAETNRTLPARVVNTVQQAINGRVIR